MSMPERADTVPVASPTLVTVRSTRSRPADAPFGFTVPVKCVAGVSSNRNCALANADRPRCSTLAASPERCKNTTPPTPSAQTTRITNDAITQRRRRERTAPPPPVGPPP